MLCSIALPLAEMCLNTMKYVVQFNLLPLSMLLPFTNTEFLMATGVQSLLCADRMLMFSQLPSPAPCCCSFIEVSLQLKLSTQCLPSLGPFRRMSKWQTPCPPPLAVEAHCTLRGQPLQARLDSEKTVRVVLTDMWSLELKHITH